MELPSARMLAELPRWAVGAYATRTARRAFRSTCALAGLPVDAAEDMEIDLTLSRLERFLEQPDEELDYPEQPDLAQFGVDDELDAAVIDSSSIAYALVEELRDGLDPTDSSKDVQELIQICLRLRDSERMRAGLARDFGLLLNEARASGWSDDTPIPRDFFALRSSFDPHQEVRGRSIISISAEFGRKLLDYFAQHPTELYRLEPRQFEELVADLFDRKGCNVRLTARTRDGGYDMLAVHARKGGKRFLVETKRWAPDNHVSVGVIRELHGVSADWQRQNPGESVRALLVTSSWFTPDAKAHLARNNHLLEGVDFDRLSRWLHRYQDLELGQSSEH